MDLDLFEFLLKFCFAAICNLQKRKRERNSLSPSSSKRKKLNDDKTCSEADQNGDYCSSLTDAGLAELANGFPRIEKLSLVWCPNVSSVGLRSLAQRCTSLRSLDLQVNFSSLVF